MAKYSIDRIKSMTYEQLANIWDNYWEYEAALGSDSNIPFYIKTIGDEMDYRIRNYASIDLTTNTEVRV